ncbi:MAG: Holliday junction branch migration protein RuvA [Propionibacteriaceae bacterium]|jgi:Holliday junction DNA helicase RuvA|nr:Holliday junction branch migration protein RuvA [Propionibacteriaceae bacterium]
MIASISGLVQAADTTGVTVVVGGIGFRVLVTPETGAQARVGAEITLHTALIVREDSLTLYGFNTVTERAAFELLLTASGVGPRTALAAVSVLPPAELAAAIRSENLVALTKVPGIGKKGAQRIVIELKDKVLGLGWGETSATDTPADASGGEVWREQVIDGLRGLGWNQKDAENAADQVAPLAADHNIAELMRAALRTFARP